MWNLLRLCAACWSVCLLMGQSGPAADVVKQKTKALRMFRGDHAVQEAVQKLQRSGYRLLTTETLPIRFAFSDEGPAAEFVVTAWLGKTQTTGWTAAFVSARVNTDSFGPPSVRLLDGPNILRE